jgi:hypothetical protein
MNKSLASACGKLAHTVLAQPPNTSFQRAAYGGR